MFVVVCTTMIYILGDSITISQPILASLILYIWSIKNCSLRNRGNLRHKRVGVTIAKSQSCLECEMNCDPILLIMLPSRGSIRNRFGIHITLQKTVRYCYGYTTRFWTSWLTDSLSAPFNLSSIPNSSTIKLFENIWSFVLNN